MVTDPATTLPAMCGSATSVTAGDEKPPPEPPDKKNHCMGEITVEKMTRLTRLKKPPDRVARKCFVEGIVRKGLKLNVVIKLKIEQAVTVVRDAGLKLCMWGSVMTV